MISPDVVQRARDIADQSKELSLEFEAARVVTRLRASLDDAGVSLQTDDPWSTAGVRVLAEAAIQVMKEEEALYARATRRVRHELRKRTGKPCKVCSGTGRRD